MYIVSRINSRLHVLGRLVVDKIVDQDTANAHFDKPVWPARDHLLGCPPFMAFHPDITVPDEQLNHVKFITKKGTTGLAFNKDGLVDQQTLRVVRELTPLQARNLFNQLLGL